MLLILSSLALAFAGSVAGDQYARQAMVPASSIAATAAAAASTMTGTPTLVSTNPTAMPLTNIIPNPVTDPTEAVFTSYAIGATPPVSGAPPLPTGDINPADYPKLDISPPTNSSQVELWMQELNGYNIPNLSVTNPGGCAANPEIVGNTSRCWWTCSLCTRETDITTCPDKMTWGLSYDDGPSPWTPALLNYLEQQNTKATFFVVGSRAISRPQLLQDEYMGGHQLCVHTWSHPYLTTLSTESIVAELGWTREAFRQIVGVSPNCMRPPYGDIDDRVRAISMAMGMTPIIWTSFDGSSFDTNDWHIPAGTVTVNQVLDTFDELLYQDAPMLNSGFIVLEHDLWQQTVDLAVGYVLPDTLARKEFKLMSIIECLNRPLSDSYVETNNNASNPPPLPATASPTSVAPGASGTQSAAGAQGTSAALAPTALASIVTIALGLVAGAVVISL